MYSPYLLGYLPDTTWSKALSTAALVLATYLLAVLLHAQLLHPLRKYPGPLYARFTRIPFWTASLRGHGHTFLHALHERHGLVVRYSPSAVSYTEPQAAAGRRENPKASWFQLPAYNGVPSIFAVPDGGGHARVRRAFAPAFSERSLKAQEGLFRRYADLLVARVREQAGEDERVEMVRMLNYTAFDIMAELCFGEPLGLLGMMDYSPWVASVFAAVRMLPFLQICAYYPVLGRLLHWLEPGWAREMRGAHFRHSADRVDRRLADGSDKPDIWNLLLSEDGKGHRLTLDEMHSNAEGFMLAGTETTATLMSGLLYHLLTNPDKLALLRAEVAAYRSPANFMRPGRFAPEKWLGDAEYAADRRDALQPFSFGPRNCVGVSFAWHEVRLVVGRLVFSFDFELCEESRDWARQRVFVLWEKNPLYLRVKPFGEVRAQ
ncbi:hypothetical protein KVR01_005885 [Diaporthe batatas]|uniref:uncharacterized protein n=1 Tax=Diaporthe batatas TaxID=748121 RepID=UPI001D0565D3|nr:uncharacterized protein KVR01_005885 [Diaporthe batatas]KAG8163967.1 hypothetical protein KVR01_005885 [Diaporthe batatas]